MFLTTADLRPWIESYESKSLDRRLTIGSLKIGWGNPLTVEFSDVRLASPSWGSSPEMVRIDSGSAAIDLWSLWGGPLRFEKLELVKPVIILERNAEGTGNWAMGAAASIPSPPAPPVASTYAAGRLKIPTLIDLAVRGGNHPVPHLQRPMAAHRARRSEDPRRWRRPAFVHHRRGRL